MYDPSPVNIWQKMFQSQCKSRKFSSSGNLNMLMLVVFVSKEGNILIRKKKLIYVWHRNHCFKSMVRNNVFKDLLRSLSSLSKTGQAEKVRLGQKKLWNLAVVFSTWNISPNRKHCYHSQSSSKGMDRLWVVCWVVYSQCVLWSKSMTGPFK